MIPHVSRLLNFGASPRTIDSTRCFAEELPEKARHILSFDPYASGSLVQP